MVSRTSEEVTSEPVIAENSEPPKTPSDTQHVEGFSSGCCVLLEDQHVVERTRDSERAYRQRMNLDRKDRRGRL